MKTFIYAFYRRYRFAQCLSSTFCHIRFEHAPNRCFLTVHQDNTDEMKSDRRSSVFGKKKMWHKHTKHTTTNIPNQNPPNYCGKSDAIRKPVWLIWNSAQNAKTNIKPHEICIFQTVCRSSTDGGLAILAMQIAARTWEVGKKRTVVGFEALNRRKKKQHQQQNSGNNERTDREIDCIHTRLKEGTRRYWKVKPTRGLTRETVRPSSIAVYHRHPQLMYAQPQCTATVPEHLLPIAPAISHDAKDERKWEHSNIVSSMCDAYDGKESRIQRCGGRKDEWSEAVWGSLRYRRV